jgi:ABC-type multidrug transport system ATPase subunit
VLQKKIDPPAPEGSYIFSLMTTATLLKTSSPPPSSWGRGVLLHDAGKRFNREWIFRHFTYSFQTGISYAITGPNGSGKSTLLQAIAGSLNLSEGSTEYRMPNIEQGVLKTQQETDEPATGNPEHKTIDPENFYQHLSIVAPYLDLVEEMTAKEFLHFHQQFKPFLPTITIAEILSVTGLEKAADKQIRYFSSGMKQRLKLAQAIFSDVPVLLLDEPCTNLDSAGYQLYHTLIHEHCNHKLVIVSSNDAQEMDFCSERISITHYK